MSDPQPASPFPEPLTTSSLRVTEVKVETTGRMPRRPSEGTAWSTTALVMGIVSLALTPVFGAGVVPAAITVALGHIAKRIEPRGRVRASIGLGAAYLALVVGTAILIFVVLPITLALLQSTGWVLTD